MIGLDMDIDAELGIDSIKRVEILAALQEQRPIYQVYNQTNLVVSVRYVKY